MNPGMMKAFLLFFGVFGMVSFQALSALAQSEVDKMNLESVSDTIRAKKLLEEAQSQFKKGDYQSSVSSLLESKTIFEQSSSKGHASYLHVLYWLGTNYMYSNQMDSAILYLKEGLAIIEYKNEDNILDIGKVCGQIGYCYEYLGEFSKAFTYKQREVILYENRLDKNDPALAKAYNNLAASYQTLGDLKNTIKYLYLAEKIILNNDESGFGDLSSIYLNIGSTLLDWGRLNEALPMLEKSLYYSKKYNGYNSLVTSSILNQIGVFYESRKDYKKALGYKMETLKIRKQVLEPHDPYIGFSYNNIGTTYNLMQQHDKASLYANLAVNQLKEAMGSENYYVGQILTGLGLSLLGEKDYDGALNAFQQSLEISKKTVGVDHLGTANSYHNLGWGLQRKFELERSIAYFDTTLIIREKLLGSEHHLVALTKANLASNYRMLGDYEKSTFLLQQALEGINYQSLDRLNEVKEYETLLMVFKENLEIYFEKYRTSRNIEELEVLLDQLRAAIKVIKYIGLKTNSRNYHVFTSYIPSLIEKGLMGITQNFRIIEYRKDAYSLIQSSKSMHLYQSIQESSALQYAGIPDSLLEKEYNLRVDLAYYDKKRQEKLQEGLEETDTTVLAISSKLFDLNQSYDSLKVQLEGDYPEYYKLKYDLSTVSLEEVQMEILEEDQALLEYFVGDSSIFIFRIEKDYYEVKEVKRDFPLEEWVQQLRDNISQPLPFAYEAYLEVAPKLYEKLIAPVAEGLPQKLVIVPDGILGYIPFEALLMEKPDINNLYAAEQLPYLLRKHQVSYCYSATLLKEMKEKKHRKAPARELLAVAPFATVDTVLSSHLDQSDWLASTRSDTLWGLPYTQAELDSIQRVFKTDAFYGAEATEASFVERAGDYRILHLSTHGKADPRVGDYSYLAFYPKPDSLENELLYVRDLYNLQLNADLVVLSACETGTGELQRGEGIISLARAFAYAGAKSIATTLWQVNDQSTQELMVSFYQNLKSGMTKDAALRQAKLDYLDGHNDTGAYPFYWAAFIGVGDMGRF